LGEVEMAAGRTDAAMSLLADVRRQAEQRGYHLIAYKAARVSPKSAPSKTTAKTE